MRFSHLRVLQDKLLPCFRGSLKTDHAYVRLERLLKADLLTENTVMFVSDCLL